MNDYFKKKCYYKESDTKKRPFLDAVSLQGKLAWDALILPTRVELRLLPIALCR